MTTMKVIMSERAPVTIITADWPIIAEASRHDGAVACQANNEWSIVVREHTDGRRLVYGWQVAGNGGQHAGFRPRHAGWVVDKDDDDDVTAIRRVAGVIGDEQLGAECISDLPATVL